MAKFRSQGAFSLTGVIVANLSLSTPVIRGMLLSILQRRARAMVDDWYKITATWEHAPVFESQVRYAGGTLVSTVWTEDEIVGYLDGGTFERWAIMGRDFQPKTAKRWIGSSPGAGGAVVIGRRKMKNPMPGIEAREWSLEIYDKHQPLLESDLNRAFVSLWAQRIIKI